MHVGLRAWEGLVGFSARWALLLDIYIYIRIYMEFGGILQSRLRLCSSLE